MEKFYEVKAKDLDLVRKKLKIGLNLQKLSPRPDIPKKLGTNLEYSNTYTEISQLNAHRPQYDVQRLERHLEISKQVISDKRGCFR